jgi:ABC-2 type transport system permease protein
MLVPATVSLVMLAVGGAAIGASYGATVNDPSQVWRFAGASIAYWPTMLLVIAVVVGCAAWIPRAASAVAWAFYSLCLLVAMMGGLLSLPDWLLNNTPFTAVPRVGATEFSVTPLLILGAIAIVIGAAGLARLRSRDMSNA